jgi:REP element-mobilizing transposase RayT
VFSKRVDQELKNICLEIEKRYEIYFLEFGTDKDHVHLLIQSVPTYNITKIIRTIKSITARQIFEIRPEVKDQLWGGKFWSDGYFAATVGRNNYENQIKDYVKNQDLEKTYTQLSKRQLKLI